MPEVHCPRISDAGNRVSEKTLLGYSVNKGEKEAGQLRSPNPTTVVVVHIQGHRASSTTHAFPGGVDL